MSSVDRPLAGETLIVRIDNPPAPIDSVARSARTLIRDGSLRVTLGSLAPGSGLPTHVAAGPVTLQPLSGTLIVSAAGKTHQISVGELLALQGGVEHSVEAPTGATYLLTVIHPDDGTATSKGTEQ